MAAPSALDVGPSPSPAAPEPNSGISATGAAAEGSFPAAARMDHLLADVAGALAELGNSDTSTPAHSSGSTHLAKSQAELVAARLGMAASLFTALRCKHAETAAHSVRVALCCSAWGLRRRLPAEEQTQLEIAALLHDIGKIGLPDSILLKPGQLSAEEQAVVDRHRLMGVEIMSASSASYELLEIASNVPAWYDGTRLKLEGQGGELPLAARMIAIVDAYDAMVNPQVYRGAFTHERAVQELRAWAGRQFDPRLVAEFVELMPFDPDPRRAGEIHGWLSELGPRTLDTHWQLNHNFCRCESASPTMLFQQRLLDNMYDAVIFLDTNLQVMVWNRGAERLTGISSASVYQRIYSPQLLRLRDEDGREIPPGGCPVDMALKSRVQSMRRLVIRGRGEKKISVNMHTIPVLDNHGVLFGAAVLLHDASGEVTLEEQCQAWQARATRDPLTQLANRAEFERAFKELVKEHFDRSLPCSVIITDIDRFKSVNDTYGHQVGDQVLISYAQVLQNISQMGYFAARYGGEEFVILCADCNAQSAAALADRIRVMLSEIRQSGMGGRGVTASFGVTELQAGDSPEIMLRRADRALYMAKEAGRNRVVQLGVGFDQPVSERREVGWWRWLWGSPAATFQRKLMTTVPLPMTIEKLRGFISDHKATVLNANDNQIRLEVSTTPQQLRRRTDRTEVMILDLNFTEKELPTPASGDKPARLIKCTLIDVSAAPKWNRNRRRDDVEESAKQTLASIKAYLIANDADEELEINVTA
ncbi:MAG: diguanylate cyclase [Pirellulales bacterium]|nr:diguanylate cyclase [Pirellulales bacterium]